jgi:hypothetical protein
MLTWAGRKCAARRLRLLTAAPSHKTGRMGLVDAIRLEDAVGLLRAKVDHTLNAEQPTFTRKVPIGLASELVTPTIAAQ